MHHHLLVHLRSEIEESIMARMFRTSRLDQHSNKVMCQKEIVVIMYMVRVVETTLVTIVMATHFASSAIKRYA